MLTIATAAQAAPKPLSIFTTVSPEAHELSMAKSGTMPPRCDPYPTDVGTPTTGQATHPAITDGSAPSIPAIAIMTAAFCKTS